MRRRSNSHPFYKHNRLELPAGNLVVPADYIPCNSYRQLDDWWRMLNSSVTQENFKDKELLSTTVSYNKSNSPVYLAYFAILRIDFSTLHAVFSLLSLGCIISRCVAISAFPWTGRSSSLRCPSTVHISSFFCFDSHFTYSYGALFSHNKCRPFACRE